MPQTTEANQRIREAQRAKILESARNVFARKGMAATITDIAAEDQATAGNSTRHRVWARRAYGLRHSREIEHL